MDARAVRATLNNAGRVSGEDFVLSSPGDADSRGKPFPVQGGQRMEAGLEAAFHFGQPGNCSLVCSPRQASPSNNVSYLKGENIRVKSCIFISK